MEKENKNRDIGHELLITDLEEIYFNANEIQKELQLYVDERKKSDIYVTHISLPRLSAILVKVKKLTNSKE
jgi:hypothetical protein